MLEQQEEQFTNNQEGFNEKQLFQKNVDDFITAIPEKGPLYEKTEKREMATRAIAFGQLFNQLLFISRGARNLNKEQILEIMKRIETLKKEAAFWTRQTDSERNFAQEINDMAKGIWRR